MGIIENKPNEATLWSLITIIYVVSLIVAYFVLSKWEKRKEI
jgi:ABC-type polysaccharide/polyol phosphate export permease